MGATEEFRKRQGSETKSGPPPFQPDSVVEKALADALQAAHKNFHNYKQRERAYLQRARRD